MKTKRMLMCAAGLLVAACEEKTDRATYFRETSGVLESGDLLCNALPPELLEGTPVPILLSGKPPTWMPPEAAKGPGVLGVKFGLLEENP